MPDPGNLFDYNRYMYTRGNPMKYNDPTGHCINSTTKNASDSQDYDNAECWRLANTIANMWDDTDYWKNRFTSKDVFLNSVANNANNGTAFFQGQMDNYFGSSEFKAWHTQWKQDHANDPYVDSTDDSVFQEFNVYCGTHDCDGILIDSIGTLGAVGVAAACVPGFAICGAAMVVGTPIALVTGSVGVVRTAALTADGKATQEDLMVSTATFVIGTIGPFGRVIGPATSEL